MLIVADNDTTFDACKTVAEIETILKGLDKSTKVGVQNGTTGKLYCEGDADWGFDGFAFDTVGYNNGALAVQDILNGGCKYVVIDEGPAKAIVEKMNAAN
jgi:polar amino acid transport system substrate-binding protein